jgi:hypothetical protein
MPTRFAVALSSAFALAACGGLPGVSGIGGGTGGLTGSGSALCSADADCGGIAADCEHVNERSTGVCVDHCTASSCGDGRVCVAASNISLEASCLRTCDGGCGSGFACLEFAAGQKACFPSAWAASGGSGAKLCTQDTDCPGTDCEHVNGLTEGFCVDHCTATACASDHVCVVSASHGLEASCARTCAGPSSNCGIGFTCSPLTTGYACLPSSWR